MPKPDSHRLAWPRPPGNHQVACHCCDAIQEAPEIQEGEAAICGCCGEILFQNRPSSLARATAWSSSALILMVLVHSFPFLSMEATGIHTHLTLSQSATALAHEGDLPLAIAVVFFTIIAPASVAASVLYVTAPLQRGIALPGALTLTRWIQFFQPWSMLEVFLLGLIVSLLKLGHLAHLTYGIGLWALCGLVICLAAAVGGIDRRELWDRLEVATLQRS